MHAGLASPWPSAGLLGTVEGAVRVVARTDLATLGAGELTHTLQPGESDEVVVTIDARVPAGTRTIWVNVIQEGAERFDGEAAVVLVID